MSVIPLKIRRLAISTPDSDVWGYHMCNADGEDVLKEMWQLYIVRINNTTSSIFLINGTSCIVIHRLQWDDPISNKFRIIIIKV